MMVATFVVVLLAAITAVALGIISLSYLFGWRIIGGRVLARKRDDELKRRKATMGVFLAAAILVAFIPWLAGAKAIEVLTVTTIGWIALAVAATVTIRRNSR